MVTAPIRASDLTEDEYCEFAQTEMRTYSQCVLTAEISTQEPQELCLNPEQQKKLANGVQNLARCQIDLAAKELLIQERMMSFNGAPALAWWQEPTYIVGGMIFSFSAGGILTYYLLKK